MIKGETIILKEKTQSGVDPFGKPIYEFNDVSVENVVVGSPTFEAVTTDLNLEGKRLAFVLGIPKGDTHDWKDAEIVIRGELFKSYGFPLTQTAENVPTRWNTQVKVEKYE